jgi:hypothetical protein
MRATSIILAILVPASVGGAFFAGHYIGNHDTQKRNTVAMKHFQADQSASNL